MLRVGLDLAAAFRERLRDRGLADDFAHRTLGCRFHGAFRIADIEQVGLRVLDEPEDGEVDVDDVFITGQHQRLFRQIATRAGPGYRPLAGAKPDLGTVDAGDARTQHALDRRRQVIVQAGLGGAVIRPKTEHHANLVGQDTVDPACQPQHDDGDNDDRDAGAHAGAAGEETPEPVLTAAQHLLEIRRLRTTRAPRAGRSAAVAAPAAPRAATAAARPGAPGTTALTLPDHRTRPFPRPRSGPRFLGTRGREDAGTEIRPIEGARAGVVKCRRRA